MDAYMKDPDPSARVLAHGTPNMTADDCAHLLDQEDQTMHANEIQQLVTSRTVLVAGLRAGTVPADLVPDLEARVAHINARIVSLTTEGKSRVQAVQERRRSNAAGAHQKRPDRAADRRNAIRDSKEN